MGKSRTREQKRVSAYGAGRVAIFSKVVSEGLTGKVISQQRPEGSERVRLSGQGPCGHRKQGAADLRPQHGWKGHKEPRKPVFLEQSEPEAEKQELRGEVMVPGHQEPHRPL